MTRLLRRVLSFVASPVARRRAVVVLAVAVAGCHPGLSPAASHPGLSPAAADAEQQEVFAQNAAATNAALARAHLTLVAMRPDPPLRMRGSPGSFTVFRGWLEPPAPGEPEAVLLFGWSDRAPLVARAPDGKLHEVRVQPTRHRERLIEGCLRVGGLPPNPPEWFLPLANVEEFGSPLDLPVDALELDDRYTNPPCPDP